MKKITHFFPRRRLLTIAVVSGMLMAGCSNSSDYSKEGETAVLPANDSMLISHDTALHNSTMVAEGDTNTTLAGTKVATSDPNKTKSSKKAKVSIVPAAPDKTTAMEMDKEGFYRNTEVLPAYPGGQKALERFFEDNLQYPEAATENDAQGIVKLTFSVDENGKIYQPMAVGDKIGYGIEEEAIRVFNKMPRWTPGKIKGKNVKTRYTLPVRFELY